jgi:DNA-binding response OmpR family regulator
MHHGGPLRRGYAVNIADNGADAEYYGNEGSYDAVTLGLNANPLIGLKRFRRLLRVCGQRPAIQELLTAIKVTR